MSEKVKPKPGARVTATFALPLKAAPALEGMLRGLTAHISCKVLEIKTDAEQIPQQAGAPDAELGSEQQGDGRKPGKRDAGKNGFLARIARKVTRKG